MLIRILTTPRLARPKYLGTTYQPILCRPLHTTFLLNMEYDKATIQSTPNPSTAASDKSDSRGHARVPGQVVDTSVLNEPITLPFSGRTAKNRFLKAPMTERLCQWNAEGEDIVSCSLLESWPWNC